MYTNRAHIFAGFILFTEYRPFLLNKISFDLNRTYSTRDYHLLLSVREGVPTLLRCNAFLYYIPIFNIFVMSDQILFDN